MTRIAVNLDENVRESLRNKIIAGEIPGGSHLSELKLSKEFNVSRTPIREALCALAADGMIEMIPHRGAFVRQVGENEQADQYFVYSQMMGVASRMATEKFSIETLMDLETAISFMSTKDSTAFSKAAWSVSEIIITTAGSPSLNTVLETISRRMMLDTYSMSSSEHLGEMQQEYTYLLGAIKRKKGDVAEKTMRNIMNMFGKWGSNPVYGQTTEEKGVGTPVESVETTASSAN